MIPYPHQEDLSDEGLAIIRQYGLVFFAMEERTGKTLTAILTVEKSAARRCLVLTKKKAITGWDKTLYDYGYVRDFEKYVSAKAEFTVINYEQMYKGHKVRKRIKGRMETVTEYRLKPEYDPKHFDVIIADESHAYISSVPKPSVSAKILQQIAYDKPVIFLSATPHAQGFQLMFHQLGITKYSPWDSYKSFYAFHHEWGVPDIAYTASGQKETYKRVQPLVAEQFNHLMIRKTRAELGFEHEPYDVIHHLELDEATKEIYNSCQEDEMFILNDLEIPLDSSMKLRTTLHMIEGGAFKDGDRYGQLQNREKIDAIRNDFGDREDTVIMFHYKAEGIKLAQYFKRATLLQGTSNAEGVDLSSYRHLIIYSQDFSTAKHSQRRARQASKNRDEPIAVHFYLVKGAISEQVYETVSINKKNFIDSIYERKSL